MSTERTFTSARERIAEPENQGYLAHKFWRVAIGLTLALVLAVMGYGAFEFLRPAALSTDTTVPPSAQVLNATELNEAIEKLDARTERFQDMIAD